MGLSFGTSLALCTNIGDSLFGQNFRMQLIEEKVTLFVGMLPRWLRRRSKIAPLTGCDALPQFEI